MKTTEVTVFSDVLLGATNDLISQLSSSASPLSEASLQAILKSDASHLLMAEEDGVYLGCLTLVVFPIPTGIRAWIEDVVVSESARGKGVGRLLSEHAVSLADELGAVTIDLTSRPSREAANKLYKGVGFELRNTNVYRYKTMDCQHDDNRALSTANPVQVKPARYETVVGIPERFRAAAAWLYDEAFGQKFAVAIPKQEDRIRLFEERFDLQHALAAIAEDKLLGIAGFSTGDGSLTGRIDYSDLLSHLGLFGGNRAAIVLALYERKSEPGELLMDGIAVDSDSRGMGVGTHLLSKLVEYARGNDYQTIRLDVIDTNAGARNLYERVGFTATKTEDFEFLRGVLGFGASTTMAYEI